MKRFLAVCCFFICALGIGAQTLSVTATITDSDSTVWANGTWSVQLTGPASAYYYNGTSIPLIVQTGSLSNVGALAVTLYNSSTITPTGSSYQFQLCSNTSASCSVFNTFVTQTNLTSLLSSLVTAPRFGASPTAYGYADVEVKTPIQIGGTYFNVNSNNIRIYYNSSWSNIANSGAIPVTGTCYQYPCVVYTTTLTNQTAAIGPTNTYQAVSGHSYRVNAMLIITTAGSAGNVSVYCGGNNIGIGGGTQNFSGGLGLSSTCFAIYYAGQVSPGYFQFNTTVSGNVGGVYAVNYVVEQLN